MLLFVVINFVDYVMNFLCMYVIIWWSIEIWYYYFGKLVIGIKGIDNYIILVMLKMYLFVFISL